MFAGEIGPARLPFDAKHPRAGLKIETDLTAGQCAAHVVRALVERSERRVNPMLAAPAAAGMGADIEAAPVVEKDRRRVDGRSHRQVGGAGMTGKPDHRAHDSDQSKTDANHSGPQFLCRTPAESHGGRIE